MADEQTPQSDLIDDAIRQAERQLEEKLEALRMSALGEPTPSSAPAPADVAVLRPTATSPRAPEPAQPEPANAPAASSEPKAGWQEAPGSDVTFAPIEPTASPTGSELYVPDAMDLAAADPDGRANTSSWADVDDLTEATSTSLAADVRDLVAVWDEVDDSYEPEVSGATKDWSDAGEHVFLAEPVSSASTEPVREVAAPREERSWETPEPIHSTWTSAAGQPRKTRPAPAASTPATMVPSEEELQFWAHTRTALRNLQQVTETLPSTVSTDVSEEVERVVRSELAPTGATLRLVQQQVQQGLPKLAERVELSIEQAMTGPNAGIRQLSDELPLQLERTVRDTRAAVREDLDHATSTLHGAVQGDVARLEDSIASNVTRMAQGTTDSVARVERDLELLGDSVSRFERGLRNEFDRVGEGMRTSIEGVEQRLREQLAEPAETVRKLDTELPARLDRVERTLGDQLQTTQHDLSSVLTNLVDANRASLDRVAAIASTLDEDRSRRAEDVEVIVDAVTTGWEGLAGAVKALFEQHEETAQRIAGIERRLGELRDLEGTVEGTMSELRTHIRDLRPAPVVVTVAHAEAEVRNTSRGGWVPANGREQDDVQD